MGRIRTIKPEFPQSETIGNLSRDARLLFIQLWTIADDSGRARAASRMLASLLYPYDDDAPGLVSKWLMELARKKCIRLYVVDECHYLEIINWEKHQKIERPSPSRIPPFAEGSPTIREDSPKDREASVTDLGPRTKDMDLGKDQVPLLAADAARSEKGATSFETFWQAYPKRCGTNSKSKAMTIYARLVKAGADPPEILAGAMRYAAHCDAEQKTGTEFVQQTTTWLNDKGWETEYVRRAHGPNTIANGFSKIDEVFAEHDRREGLREEGGEEDFRVLPGLRQGTG